jgi:hypothetical protein
MLTSFDGRGRECKKAPGLLGETATRKEAQIGLWQNTWAIHLAIHPSFTPIFLPISDFLLPLKPPTLGGSRKSDMATIAISIVPISYKNGHSYCQKVCPPAHLAPALPPACSSPRPPLRTARASAPRTPLRPPGPRPPGARSASGRARAGSRTGRRPARAFPGS